MLNKFDKILFYTCHQGHDLSLVLWLLGVMEGLQIALVELKRQNPDTYKQVLVLKQQTIANITSRETHPAAYRLGQVAMQGDNIERFLMGRQVITNTVFKLVIMEAL